MSSSETINVRGRSRTESAGTIGIYASSFGLSLGITSLFNALLVIVKETNEKTVLAWMNATGHHWVAQGVLDLIVFVVLGYGLARVASSVRPETVTVTAVGGVVVGALVVAGFYLV